MKVLAKFKCVNIIDDREYKCKTVLFSPVINDCEENRSFAKYTPAGDIRMVISDETPASTAFEVEKEYFVTFEESTKV